MTTSRPVRSPRRIVGLAALAAAVLFGCSTQQDDEEFRSQASALIAEFQGQLQTALRAALDEGGPVRAIEVCSEQAPAIAAAIAKNGLAVRRIGTRVRNHLTNEPTAKEREILAAFAALPAEQRADTVRVEGEGADRRFYAPIWVGNVLCLGCHGHREALDADVLEALKARYPDDEAVGYGLGDLRGAFVVEARP